MADQRGDVDRRLRPVDGLGIRGHRGVDILVAAAQQRQRWRRIRVHERRETDAAVADDDRRHALADLGQHLRRGEHDLVVVRVHVDESRRDDHSGGVDHLGTVLGQLRADRGDALAFDAHVGNEAGRAGAVDDRSATQEKRRVSTRAHNGFLPAFADSHCMTGCVSLSTPRSRSTLRYGNPSASASSCGPGPWGGPEEM